MYPRRLPDSNLFQEYVQANGISNKHHIIIYDRSPYGLMASARVWWILRVFNFDHLIQNLESIRFYFICKVVRP